MPLTKTEQRATAFEEFKAAFQRSRKGNLWRPWEGFTVTIFRREESQWCFCLANEAGPSYQGGYESEDEAIQGVWDWFQF